MGLERKKRYLVLHRNDGNFRRLCAMLRIAPKTGYVWLKRFDEGGLDELLREDSGGRPRQVVSDEVRNAVLELRTQHGWNEKTIRRELSERGIQTSYHAVRQTLAQANALGIAPPRRKRTFREFERPLPNDLWQADYSFLDDGTWIFAMIDDNSRYLVGAEEFEEASTENALFVFRRAMQQHGTPTQLMTDHGSQFYDNTRKKTNSFGETLDVLGVEHILAGVKRPQTNGKIERWFGSYKQEIQQFNELPEYLYHYNYCRPHGGIKYRKPYEKYFAFKL